MLRLAVTLAILLMSREAFGFCRTTTCNDSTEECKPDANGCPTVGEPVFWDRTLLPIPYAFTERGSTKLDDAKVRIAVRAAVAKWESVVCAGGGRTSLRFRELADIPAEEGLGLASNDDAEGRDDGTPPFGIYFRDRTWKDKQANALALTSLVFFGARVTVAKMELNTATTKFKFDSGQESADVDFQAVVTHEMGHYIGIAHSAETDSIMAPDYCHWKDRCETSVGLKRALSRDDTAAVCALYPAVHATLPPTGDPRAETAGCRQAPGSSSLAGAALVLMATVAAVRKRRGFRAGA